MASVGAGLTSRRASSKIVEVYPQVFLSFKTKKKKKRKEKKTKCSAEPLAIPSLPIYGMASLRVVTSIDYMMNVPNNAEASCQTLGLPRISWSPFSFAPRRPGRLSPNVLDF